jgi:hypothetical protein
VLPTGDQTLSNLTSSGQSMVVNVSRLEPSKSDSQTLLQNGDSANNVVEPLVSDLGLSRENTESILSRHPEISNTAAKQQRKLERSNNYKFPWLNSEKVNIVTVKLPNCEISSHDDPLIESNDVSVECESNIVRIIIYSMHTLPYILAMVKNVAEQLFIDTGSTLNLCAFGSYPEEHVTPVNGLEVTSASGHIIPLCGKIILEVMLGNITIPVEFIMIKGLEMKLLLGNSVFRTYDFKMNYKDMQCEFQYNNKSSGPIPLLLLEGPSQLNPILQERE